MNQEKNQTTNVRIDARINVFQNISGFFISFCARFKYDRIRTNVVVIPKNNKKRLEVDLELFLNSVDRVASVSLDKKDGVKFN